MRFGSEARDVFRRLAGNPEIQEKKGCAVLRRDAEAVEHPEEGHWETLVVEGHWENE